MQNVTVIEVYSRIVVLSWMPPDPENQNGVITEYQLLIHTVALNHSDHLTFPNTTCELSNLKPHTTYQVGVLASTKAGNGPLSEILTFITLEDGRSSLWI